jgi:hypothetical protein
MGEVDEFIYQFLYDIGSRLRSELDALKEDLLSDDAKTRKLAEEKFDKLSRWILPPLPPLSEEQRLLRAQERSVTQTFLLQSGLKP